MTPTPHAARFAVRERLLAIAVHVRLLSRLEAARAVEQQAAALAAPRWWWALQAVKRRLPARLQVGPLRPADPFRASLLHSQAATLYAEEARRCEESASAVLPGKAN